MARYRLITKYGSSFVIRLHPHDMEDLKLSRGDLVDIEDIVIKRRDELNLEEDEDGYAE